MEDVPIPDKLYFKIGEVAELTGIKPHVLRYWESEFGSVRPGKNRHSQRLYQRKDIELILRLKDLLYTQGFTIAGARRKLAEKSSPPRQMQLLPADREHDLLQEIRRDLLLLRKSLESSL